jgi:hypothetical protein
MDNQKAQEKKSANTSPKTSPGEISDSDLESVNGGFFDVNIKVDFHNGSVRSDNNTLNLNK